MADGKTRRDKLNAKYRDIREDEGGNLVYAGDSFRMAGDANRRRLTLIALLVLEFAVVVGSGCIDAAGATNAFYVILPYIGEVSALFALCWTSVKLLAGGDAVRKYVLDNARTKIPGEARILTVFALLGLLLSALYLMRNSAGGELFKSVLYLVLKAAAAVTAETYRRTFADIRWDMN